MASEIEKIIEEQFHKLPPVIKDVVMHSNWQAKIRRIVQNHKLHLDQGAAIESVVILTMLGVYTPEDFVETAQKLARVSPAEAEAISIEVEREIFHEIRQKLIEITESHDTIDEVERVTNELTKVDDDIERGAAQNITAPTTATKSSTSELLDEVTIPSKATNNTLKEQPAILALREMNEQAKKKTIELTKAPIPAFKKTIPLTRPTDAVSTQNTPRVIVTLKKNADTTHTSPQTADSTQDVATPVATQLTTPTPTILTSKPATSAVATPTETDIAQKPPIAVFTPIPKSLDPIIAAKLGKPTASARDRLEMEVSDSVLKTGEEKITLEDVASTANTQPKQYSKTDPYREIPA